MSIQGDMFSDGVELFLHNVQLARAKSVKKRSKSEPYAMRKYGDGYTLIRYLSPVSILNRRHAAEVYDFRVWLPKTIAYFDPMSEPLLWDSDSSFGNDLSIKSHKRLLDRKEVFQEKATKRFLQDHYNDLDRVETRNRKAKGRRVRNRHYRAIEALRSDPTPRPTQPTDRNRSMESESDLASVSGLSASTIRPGKTTSDPWLAELHGSDRETFLSERRNERRKAQDQRFAEYEKRVSA
jgi:hypothetical protein